MSAKFNFLPVEERVETMTKHILPQKILLFLIAFTLLAFMQQNTAHADGQTLFNTHCMACHSIGGGRLVGPDLSGISKRKSEAWLVKFIQSPQSVINGGDAYAKNLLQEYNGLMMPDQPLSDGQTKEILAYIKAGPAKGAAATTKKIKYTQAEVDLGLALFQGTERFENKGPACNSCHHVKNDAVIGGGVLAADLTEVFSRLGHAGVKSILGKAPFPVMEQAYRDKPLTEAENKALVAFLQYSDKEHFYQQPRDFGLRLFVTGVVGVAVLFGLIALFGSRRKKKGVYDDVYERQEEQLKK